MAEIVYSIRVDASLVRAFAASSLRAGTTAAERLRQFMRDTLEAEEAAEDAKCVAKVETSSGVSAENGSNSEARKEAKRTNGRTNGRTKEASFRPDEVGEAVSQPK